MYSFFFLNLAHTYPNKPSNLYLAKILSILLLQQSQWQGPWISFISSTELMSSFPLVIEDGVYKAAPGFPWLC